MTADACPLTPAPAPEPAEAGDPAEGECLTCGGVFVYSKKMGRPRRICDGCRRKTVKRAHLRWAKEVRCLKVGELNGNNSDGFYGVALLTQEEVAEVMGISRARIQQIERTAMWKLRRDAGLRQLWREHLEAAEASGRIGLRLRAEGDDEEHLLSRCERQIDSWLSEHAPLVAQECPMEAEELRAAVEELRGKMKDLKFGYERTRD